ncbi:MAG TPA: TIR domain-containing protein, partial [Candidatus Angelobacter sp.]|nr:TIR domain-containing protein [Candidatus Angelobacter sp.]
MERLLACIVLEWQGFVCKMTQMVSTSGLKKLKPKVFIGSSSEGLLVAETVQAELERICDSVVWTQDVFEINKGALESLLKDLKTADFAILVFTADDNLRIRGRSFKAARDNVVFELGLFTGWLGRERCFILKPRNANLRVPTDLAGLKPGEYDGDREDKNFRAAIGPAMREIKNVISKIGLFHANEENATDDYGTGHFPNQVDASQIEGLWL